MAGGSRGDTSCSEEMDRRTLSASKVEKAREAIDFLSSLSLPHAQASGASSSHRTPTVDLLIKMVCWEVTLGVG